MRFKEEARKKRMKKQNLQADENASVSSELNDDEEKALEQEILEKLRKEHEIMDDDLIEQISDQDDSDDKNIDYDDKTENLKALDMKLAKLYDSIQSTNNDKIAASLALAILFYFYKRAKKEQVQSHPVIKRIAQLESALKSTAIKVPNPTKVNTKGNTIQQSAKLADEDKPRLITNDMYKNRGIPTLRSIKKQKLNPRLKQKAKYRKAQTKLRSKGLLKKGIESANKYTGERTGIKTGINRALTIG